MNKTKSVFSEFNPNIHCTDKADISNDWTHFVGIDPCEGKVRVMLFGAWSPEGKLVIYDEKEMSNESSL